MEKYLDNPNFDVKNLASNELSALCAELRDNIITSVTECGGHLASNLGVVELTVALHRTLELPNEKLIFDVSHQSYVHKMLSGRANGFEKLRSENGISGFQTRSEGEYDFFGGGHSGTAISAALGFAEAEKMKNGKNYAVAVVGDGSFTNGMIYEALNNASKRGLKLIIILNDNEMSISKNVGGVSRYFSRLRTSVGYFRFKRRFKHRLSRMKLIGRPIAAISGWTKNTIKRLIFQKNIFEHLGMDYMGPVDGHDIAKLEAVIKEAKLVDNPVVIHVCTTKGKGYAPAEENPADYHALSPKTTTASTPSEYKDFSDCFGKTLCELAAQNSEIVAITAAMSRGTGLSEFKNTFPKRFFDVGIAEAHAVTFAAGLAASGKRPVFAVYSSFLQRSFDQIIHDVAIQELPVIFAIDRSGFVPGDGATHQGIFDLSFLLSIPKMHIYTPAGYNDLKIAIEKALHCSSPSAVRYPKASEHIFDTAGFTETEYLRYRDFGSGPRVNIVTYGTSLCECTKAAELLSKKCSVRVIGIKQVKPFDSSAFYQLCADAETTVFVEEQIKTSSFAEHITAVLSCNGTPLKNTSIIAVDEGFPTHADIKTLYKIHGMDAESIASTITKHLNNRN